MDERDVPDPQDHQRLNRSTGRAASPTTRHRRVRPRPVRGRPGAPLRRRALRPYRASATSPDSTSSTCSATSAPTRCRWRGWARASPASTSRPRRSRRPGACRTTPARRSSTSNPSVYGAVDVARRGAVRPRLHRRRRAVLAADVRRWADVVAALLRPGGRLFIREGHPMLWALADARDDGVVAIEYPYFETSGTAFDNTMTYVDHEGEVEHRSDRVQPRTGEIITARDGRRTRPARVRGARLGAVAGARRPDGSSCRTASTVSRDRPERLAAQLHAASPQAVS